MSDLISRQAAIDALTRKMVSIPTAGEKDLMGDVNRIRAEDISVIRRLPSAQPEPCEDAVSRSQLRLMKTEECAGHTIEYAMGWKACIEWIKTLPSVRPEQEGDCDTCIHAYVNTAVCDGCMVGYPNLYERITYEAD